MKLKYMLLIATLIGFSTSYAGDIFAPAKPQKPFTAPTTHGPGTLVGLDFGYYHNTYHDHSAGKTTNPGPSGYVGFMPNVQFYLLNNWAASIGIGINSYHDVSDFSPFHSDEKEMYFGPSLSLYHYCDDPCDDDLYPFFGFDAFYYTGPRTYTHWQDNGPDLTHHVEKGKLTESGLGIFGGANYNLGKHFGVSGRVNVLDYTMDKTVYDKTNPDYFRSSGHLNIFREARAGIYLRIGNK
jgi:hypothetical protein